LWRWSWARCSDQTASPVEKVGRLIGDANAVSVGSRAPQLSWRSTARNADSGRSRVVVDNRSGRLAPGHRALVVDGVGRGSVGVHYEMEDAQPLEFAARLPRIPGPGRGRVPIRRVD
jgi:hypothetical protein